MFHKVSAAILWPVIDPILVTFGQMKFSPSQLAEYSYPQNPEIVPPYSSNSGENTAPLLSIQS